VSVAASVTDPEVARALAPRTEAWSIGRPRVTPPADGYETGADEGPEPRGGDHGTCATCGGQIHYQACPTGGWWIHDAHPADGHDAQLGGPA
jgi:hypothetical protein